MLPLVRQALLRPPAAQVARLPAMRLPPALKRPALLLREVSFIHPFFHQQEKKIRNTDKKCTASDASGNAGALQTAAPGLIGAAAIMILAL